MAEFIVRDCRGLAGVQFDQSGGDLGNFGITVLSGLFQGMLLFLVASGLSIIFGLMDVLNLAQGTVFHARRLRRLRHSAFRRLDRLDQVSSLTRICAFRSPLLAQSSSARCSASSWNAGCCAGFMPSGLPTGADLRRLAGALGADQGDLVDHAV